MFKFCFLIYYVIHIGALSMHLAQFVLCMFCSVPLIHQTEKANHGGKSKQPQMNILLKKLKVTSKET